MVLFSAALGGVGGVGLVKGVVVEDKVVEDAEEFGLGLALALVVEEERGRRRQARAKKNKEFTNPQ